MKLILKLAWRNVWRNKRRSLLTLLAIAFAAMAAIAMRGLQLGTYAVNISNAVEMFSGYMQIQHEDYNDSPSIRDAFKFDDELKEMVENTKGVTNFAPRVYADGLISYKDATHGSSIFGISPEEEEKVTTIHNRINGGRFLSAADNDEVVLGYKLLQNLKAEIGDTVVILAQGYDGALGNLKFKIVGTFKFGSPQFDMMGIFMGIETAQEMLALYGKVHAVAVSVSSIDEISPVQKSITGGLNNGELTVLNWEELMPEMKQSIALDNISGALFLLILMIIVTFGILNTVLMSVTERFNEFGVTLSIGMPQIKLVILVLIETAFIALLGIIIGDIIGGVINAYFINNPITFGGEFAAIYEEYGFLPRMESSLELGIFISVSFSIFVISLLATIYPLIKVYKLEPLKGIRYT